MKTFFKRSGIFALIDIILLGLLVLVSGQPFDTCVIGATLCSCFLGLPYEFLAAIKQDRKPIYSEGLGAAFFGSIAASFVIYAIYLIV